MHSKKIIGLSLVSVMLLSNTAFAADLGSNTEGIKSVPISGPLFLDEKVDICTAKEIKSEIKLVKYNVRIPNVQRLKDAVYQEQLNYIIISQAMKDIKNVETKAEELATKAEKEGREFRPFEIYIDFDVKSNDSILSFAVTTYAMTGGANGNTRVDCYNIDTKQSKRVELKDLFKSDTDYKAIINKEISAQIEAQKQQENKSYFEGDEGFKTVSDFQGYYIKDGNLVVVFPRYSIAPGHMGTPEFKIPLESLSDILQAEEQTKFNSITGTVKEIVDSESAEDFKILWLEDKEGNPVNFIISKDTSILNNANITEGSTITGFYDVNAPMTMIYPPRYNVKMVAVSDQDQNVKLDRFDKDLVSFDKTLKLNVTDKTEIVLQDGTTFDGELANRKLVVIYGVSTRSIPAQTSPTKIIVLFEKAVAPIYNLTDVNTMDIVVNNKKVEAPAAYTNKQGTVMVPLRAIGEALGFEVAWNNKLKSVMLGKGISLRIGEDNYIYMKTAPIQLGTAPEIRDGKTYVPLNFFKKVVQMNNAYVFESQIVIDNAEKME